MRVTAREIMERVAAPLPGDGAFPPRPKAGPPARPRPAAPSPSPGGDFEPEMPPPDESMAPPEQPGAEGEGDVSIESIVRDLDTYFSDAKVQDISSKMLTLMKVVPPDHGEKLSKVFTKLMEAMMAMKANMAALQVMTMPAQQQQQVMTQNLQQLTNGAPGGDQGLKSGPIT